MCVAPVSLAPPLPIPITVLRALAEGRIRWAFWPPGTDPQTISKHQGTAGAGIWIAHDSGEDGHEDSDYDSDEDEAHAGRPAGSEDEAPSSPDGSEEEAEEGDEEVEVEAPATGAGLGREVVATGGRFGALVLDDQDDDDDEA